MVRGFIAGAVAAIVVGLLCAVALVYSGFIPANADGKPTALELWAANASLTATLDREAPRGPNPVPPTDANLLNGVKLYADHCAVCHGTAAGDASASPIAKGEYPKPPQLATDGVEDDPEGFSYWKIKHGIRLTAMPSWKGTLSDQQIWTLAQFLKHMDKLPPDVEQAWRQVSN